MHLIVIIKDIIVYIKVFKKLDVNEEDLWKN